MYIKEVIRELIYSGIPVTLKCEKGQTRFYLEGFYKENGSAYLAYIEDDLVFYGRYSDETNFCVVDELRDIVQINFKKWVIYKDSGVQEWEQPNELWLPLMLKFNLVTLENQPKYIPVN